MTRRRSAGSRLTLLSNIGAPYAPDSNQHAKKSHIGQCNGTALIGLLTPSGRSSNPFTAYLSINCNRGPI